MKAKLFDGWSRPRLHVAAAIAHGHHVFFYISDPTLAKDSNTSCEMIMHSLHEIRARGHQVDSLTIQADNTTREVKNGIVMRLAASLVSCGLISEAKLCFLRSGHSHEDIDQCFGYAADHVRRNMNHAQTSDDVVESLQGWLDKLPRPYEPVRQAFKLDQCRDWRLGVRFPTKALAGGNLFQKCMCPAE